MCSNPVPSDQKPIHHGAREGSTHWARGSPVETGPMPVTVAATWSRLRVRLPWATECPDETASLAEDIGGVRVWGHLVTFEDFKSRLRRVQVALATRGCAVLIII